MQMGHTQFTSDWSGMDNGDTLSVELAWRYVYP